MQPPCQELTAKDLHDQTWTFRHIYRGISIQIPSFCLIKYYSIFIIQNAPKKYAYNGSLCFFFDFRSTKKAPSNNRLECVCEFKETYSRRRRAFHKVCEHYINLKCFI